MTSLDDQVTLLKTIADPTRLRILGLLAAGPCTGRELAEELSLTPATISHHLKQLHQAGIVTSIPRGAAKVHALDEGLLSQLRGERHRVVGIADPAHQRTVGTYFQGDRLIAIPTKRRARASVLVELLRRFEPGRDYTEAEVNDVLRTAHDDVAYLRRELIEYRYLVRDQQTYRVTDQVPQRGASEAQEVPTGESDWLAALIRGTLDPA